MINITINQLVKIFRQWSEKHKMINDFGFGPVWDFGMSKEMNYPAMWVDFNPSSYYNVSKTNITPSYSFIILFVDKENIQENVLNENGYLSNNVADIMSDMEQLCRDFISFINMNTKIGISVEGNVNLTNVIDETQDKVYGFSMTLNIRTPFYLCNNNINNNSNFIVTNNNEIIITTEGDDLIL